ncbi:MAG: hypothetical protein HY608_01030 [Planctomycetes bacterium]|nr:hypothetical protein [Planctomycetota bacterium]
MAAKFAVACALVAFLVGTVGGLLGRRAADEVIPVVLALTAVVGVLGYWVGGVLARAGGPEGRPGASAGGDGKRT